MRHLENAFKVTFKNFLLTLPLLVSLAIPALISGIGSLSVMTHSGEIVENFRRMLENSTYDSGLFDYNSLFAGIDLQALIISSLISALFSFVFMLLVRPATYGIINLHYETGNAKLNDFVRCLSKYIGRFVIYGLLNIAIVMGILIVLIILVVIGTVISTISKPLGTIMIILFVLAGIVGTVVLLIYMSLWFPAVCVEDSGVIEGLKNSFRFVRGSFWPLLGITLLVNVGGSIAGGLIGGILGLIPVVGNIAAPVISGVADFILIVYYFEVYREKTGRYSIPQPPQQFGGFQGSDVQ